MLAIPPSPTSNLDRQNLCYQMANPMPIFVLSIVYDSFSGKTNWIFWHLFELNSNWWNCIMYSYKNDSIDAFYFAIVSIFYCNLMNHCYHQKLFGSFHFFFKLFFPFNFLSHFFIHQRAITCQFKDSIK